MNEELVKEIHEEIDEKYGKELKKYRFEYDSISEKLHEIIYHYNGNNSKLKDNTIEISYGINGKLVFYLSTNETNTNSYSMKKILRIIKCAYLNQEKSLDECIKEVFDSYK